MSLYHTKSMKETVCKETMIEKMSASFSNHNSSHTEDTAKRLI